MITQLYQFTQQNQQVTKFVRKDEQNNKQESHIMMKWKTNGDTPKGKPLQSYPYPKRNSLIELKFLQYDSKS